MWTRALGAIILVAILGPATAAEAKPPRGACMTTSAAGATVRQVPWAQKTLGAERAWSFSTGRGVLVAVIDSGVDTDHPQLAKPGKVLSGFDFLRNKSGADFDCVSHGTAVASIIGADSAAGIGFHGIAPGVRILPLRVSDSEPDENTTGNAVRPAVFAKAIRYAADQGAQVINLSVVMYSDVPVVRAAVRYARTKGALLVAAVGNQHRTNGGHDPIPYPAAYPGVIGVGATTIDGTRLDASQVGPYVDLVAPGGGVLAPTRQHGYVFWDGTSFATPFVSGAAALVRAEFPSLSAAQVAARLFATADPAPGGSDQYGHGMVDPYRAVAEGLAGANPAIAAAPLATPTPNTAAIKAAERVHQHAASATRTALYAILAGVFVLAVTVTLKWRGPKSVAAPVRTDNWR